MQMAFSPLPIPHPSHEIPPIRKILPAYWTDPFLGGQLTVAVRASVDVHNTVTLPLKNRGVNSLPPCQRRAAEYTGELLFIIAALPVSFYRTWLATKEITPQYEE